MLFAGFGPRIEWLTRVLTMNCVALLGTVVTLFMSRSATYGYDQRCEIFGTDGLVSITNVHEHTMVFSSHSGVQKARLQHSFPQRFHQAFAAELDAYADSLLHNIPWPVTAAQCIRVQRVADAAQESSRTGQVVTVNSLVSAGTGED